MTTADTRTPRRRLRAGALALALSVGMMGPAHAQTATPTAAEPSNETPAAPGSLMAPMSETESASMGCALVAGGVGLATLTAGGVAFIAAEAGVGAGVTSTAVAVPVVVATMAAGCNLGAMATPAFLWLKRQGHTLGSAATALWTGGGP
ncbi:hypothetical protein [Azospirillum sp.]|uniref:hypothetical protein n=1 Tax=Azospirillum sp. TaxID=34012 RepID=UPI00261E2C29|nr:hypothetical protein [Azospirillum sp.]